MNTPTGTQAKPIDEPRPEDARERAISRSLWRLGPYLVLLYVVSFLDRANIGFAKQAMQSALGISEHGYAIAAGLFFLSYSICGFPSNLLLRRIGAKWWLSSLMLAWGGFSMSTAFVTGTTSFYLLRLLLGVAEAGFFPGVVLYLTFWFPDRVRGQVLGLFYLGVPLALALGGPLSGLLLEMKPLDGFQSWQWMFLVEGSLAVILGIVSFWFLDDCPATAKWLPQDEKSALETALTTEQEQRRAIGPTQLLSLLRDLRVLRFLLIYTLIQMSTYGAIFYLPEEISNLLHQPTGLEVGVVSAIPWIFTLVAVYFLPLAADRLRIHRQLGALALLVAGCASLAFPGLSPVPGLAALSLAVAGFIAVQPIFWTFPTSYLADRAAAGGIALIGAGNLGGLIAPNIKVWADDLFQSPNAGLYLLATTTLLTSALIFLMRPVREQVRKSGM